MLDVVHSHFGLTAWPAMAVRARVHALTVHGTDVSHPRTRLATALVLPMIDLPAVVSQALLPELPGAGARRRAEVLPCGVDTGRFRPIARASARAELGLDPERPYLLFPADPARAEKRHDRAAAVAERTGASCSRSDRWSPSEVPLWVNAANAVIVPSEREGFGLAVLEALACDVPVLATPVGVHAEALRACRARCAPPSTAPSGAPPHRPSWTMRIRGSKAGRRPSATPPRRWPSVCSTHGGALWRDPGNSRGSMDRP